MEPRIVVVTGDLFFWARVRDAARAVGSEAVRVSDDAAMEAVFSQGGIRRVLADLATPGLDLHQWARRWKGSARPPELIAFGAHVDETALARAVEAGFDQVMPNSRFNRLLPRLLR